MVNKKISIFNNDLFVRDNWHLFRIAFNVKTIGGCLNNHNGIKSEMVKKIKEFDLTDKLLYSVLSCISSDFYIPFDFLFN